MGLRGKSSSDLKTAKQLAKADRLFAKANRQAARGKTGSSIDTGVRAAHIEDRALRRR
jgi:hypothetical protein